RFSRDWSSDVCSSDLGAALVTLLVLTEFGFNLSSLLSDAANESGKGEAFLEPGLRYGTEEEGLSGKIDLISLGLALVLGTAGLRSEERRVGKGRGRGS